MGLKGKLDEITKALSAGRSRWAVNAEEKSFDPIKTSLSRLFSKFDPSVRRHENDDVFTFRPNPTQPPPFPKKYIEIPASVHFVAKVVEGVPYTHRDSPTLSVLSQILSSLFLHREIREKGGAYGGGLNFSSALSFYSYRDPHFSETLRAFADAADFLGNSEDAVTDRDIMEAKLKIFSDLDQPVTPSNRGMGYFKIRVTDAMKAERRERLFKVDRSDLMEVGKKYLNSDLPASYVALGPEKDEGELGEGWTREKASGNSS